MRVRKDYGVILTMFTLITIFTIMSIFREIYIYL